VGLILIALSVWSFTFFLFTPPPITLNEPPLVFGKYGFTPEPELLYSLFTLSKSVTSFDLALAPCLNNLSPSFTPSRSKL
jgi:hypothetical protein